VPLNNIKTMSLCKLSGISESRLNCIIDPFFEIFTESYCDSGLTSVIDDNLSKYFDTIPLPARARQDIGEATIGK